MLLLNGHSLTPARKVPVEAMSLTLKERDSTATLTPGDMTGIQFGSWLQDETNPGKGIVWRVKSIGTVFNTETDTLQLEHVIALLKKPKMFGEHKAAKITGNSKATTCTAKQAIQYILSFQKDWVLGSFAFEGVSNPYKFDGDSLYDALVTVTNSLKDAMWTYSFASYPFKLNIVKKSDTVGSEMRAGRNLRTIKKNIDESGMFTRFYPIGADDLHIPGNYVSKNENVYGRIDKIETDQSLKTTAELKRWAEEQLELHAEPTMAIEVEGFELADATGEPLDRMNLGRICRVPLPKYGTMITERIVSLNYPDKVRQKEMVKVSLSNSREDVTKILGEALKKAGKGARTSTKAQKEDHAWFEDTNDHVSMCAIGIIGVDATGKPNWTRLSDITADGTGIHSTVTDLVEDVKKHETRFEQDERRIGMVVGTYSNGKDFIKAGEICLAINESGDAEATINASKIYLLGQTIAQYISADYIKNKIANIASLTVQAVIGTTASFNNLYGGNIKFRVSSGSGYVYTDLKDLFLSNIELRGPTNNVYTLVQHTPNNAQGVVIGSFSRATTLSGAWSGGVYTVNASPQDKQITSGIFDLTNSDVSWSGLTGTIKVHANINGDEVKRDTGKRLYVTAPFSQVSLSKAYDTNDQIYYGRLYDSAGHALTSGNYYWYGSSYNYDGGSWNATFYRHN